MIEGVDSLTELLKMIYGYQYTQLLAVACKLNIFDLLINGKSVSQIVCMTDSSLIPMENLLLFLEREQLIQKTNNTEYIVTNKGKLFTRNNPISLKNISIMHGGNYYWQCWHNAYSVIKTGIPGSNAAFGYDNYEYFQRNIEEYETFNNSMEDWCSLDIATLPIAYDFSKHSIIVDVGGGTGEILSNILRANERAQGILFDIDEPIRRAYKKFTGQESLNRMSLVTGSFFESVPLNGDCYILRHILHNWDDEKADDILRNCCYAMSEGARLLIIDNVYDLESCKLGHIKSMHMQVAFSAGKERTINEFKMLFEKASLHLIEQITLPSQLTLMVLQKAI